MRKLACVLFGFGSQLAGAAGIGVAVDATTNVHPFSPLIFGVAYGDAVRNAQMGYTVDRWGGNSTTRYNWQVDVHNTAGDYFWENIPDCTAPSCVGTPPVGNSADAFITGARRAASACISVCNWPRLLQPNTPSVAPWTIGQAG